jgi:lipopolysaccharide transport system permease protein
MSYVRDIWSARYFWWHLAMSDLRARWRRSFLGAAWSIIQPLALTTLLSIVFSRIFDSEIGSYAPFILSGMVIWEYVTGTIVGGALAFVQADAYIKQTRHPLAIYTLRTALANMVVLSLASVALVGWVLVALPGTFGWTWLAALTIFPLLLAIAWPAATAFAFVATRFRDLPNLLILVFQAMWFVSPIYFQESTFRHGDLHVLLDYNPIYHMLEIVRAPLLRGEWPTPTNYAWTIGTALVLAVIALLVGLRSEKRVIFYL